MTICKHRGRQVARITPCCDRPEAGQFICTQFEICTDYDLGFTNNKTGQKMATCAGCPVFSPPGEPEKQFAPLVSAVCLAYDLPRRKTILCEAVESFRRQSWPNKELLIVVDSDQRIECNVDGVRVVYAPPCKTLGDKYNAGVEAARGEFICCWDDDDISLPWRMSLSVELIGSAEYFNPKAYFGDNSGSLLHEVKTGYAHNASMYRKSAWAKVGGYQSLDDNSQDAKMDEALRTHCETVIGSGKIEETFYLYRWGNGLHHGSQGPTPSNIGTSGRFIIQPKWLANYTKMLVDARPKAIPVWLTNRDALTVKTMVEQFLLCEQVGPITIVDCDSTYQPLLDWYENECPVNVILAPNFGNMAPWKFLDNSTPYIVSDADHTLEGVPRNFAVKLRETIESNPQMAKVGLSLRIDDLPPEAPRTVDVIGHESQCWMKRRPDGHFDADIDTTPAIYKAGATWGGYGPAIRLAPPYVCRHAPWYLTRENLTPDWSHYFGRMDWANVKWGNSLASLLLPRKLTGPKLTIGMPCFRDIGACQMTIQMIRLCHRECLQEIEIVVVDNDPSGVHSEALKAFCGQNGTRYERFTEIQGTAAAKGRIFELATAPSVLVIDCHEILPSGTVRRLIDWFESHPDSKDLYQGPLISDGGYDSIAGTHFKPAWGSAMLGQWDIDESAMATGEPFEIQSMGCGLFACNKSAWPGFHPLLKGFGPEEGHLHQRFRKHGGKAICLPWLRWWHLFQDPKRDKPPGLDLASRLHGYMVTLLDTGEPPLDSIHHHYVDEMGMSQREFDAVVSSAKKEFGADQVPLSITERAASLLDTATRTIVGGEYAPQEIVEQRLQICLPCSHLVNGSCDLCGCLISRDRKFKNKLLHKSASCSHDPPKWGAVTDSP